MDNDCNWVILTSREHCNRVRFFVFGQMIYSRAILSLVIVFVASRVWADDGVDFNTHIRPLLSQHCFNCHGPDEQSREAGLRLDVFEDGLQDVIELDEPEESELLQRISETDEDIRMPPPQHGSGLKPAEIELFRQWIVAGAKYDQHWSYQPPVRPEIAISNDEWPESNIDRLTLAAMRKKGLAPSPQAAKEILIRHVALDLTGLPPTPDEVREFLNNPSPDAYEKLVDGLLAKPSFGERWAAMWLDHARYADTMGYAEDRPRTIWAYRDYVIRALNLNKPFDQFTTEQIAGDLLPNPTQEQIVATAFHRNTMTNTEGGTVDEEFRSAAVVDRVNTTMAVWMGTTIACAQCHTHKYDPITQKEYFQLYAFFNQTADNDRPNERPVYEVVSPAGQLKRRELKQQMELLAVKRNEWTNLTGEERANILGPKQQEWEQALIANKEPVRKASFVRVELPGESKILSIAEVQVFVHGQNVAAEGMPSQSSTDFEGTPDRAVDGNTDGNYDRSSVTHTNTEDSPWWELEVETPDQIEKVVIWHRTDGRLHRRSDGIVVSLLDANRDTLWNQTVEITDENADSLETGIIPEEIVQIVSKADRSEQEARSVAVFFENEFGPLKQLDLKFAKLQREFDSTKATTTVPIMKELAADKRRKTYVHHRGSYLDPGEQVECSTPSAFHSFEHEELNRLTFANWLVSKRNPLTARVIVNRFWQQLFGTGIVRTLEEFGAQGDLPSHPKLLDFLAVEFMDSGWDIKALLKQIVMSATYRQSSDAVTGQVKVDPGNVWLSRGPRTRLTAEMIRDQALAASGLLSSKMYGPPVQPPQPKLGLRMAFRDQTADWEDSTGEDRYRRAVYTRWQRSSPYPSLTTFDVSNREVCELGRLTTNTPLQALVTMNDPAYVEAAQAMARKVTVTANVELAVRELFASVLIRQPTTDEVELLTSLFRESEQHFKADSEAAMRLGVDPLNPPSEAMDTIKLAAWTTVANVILNLDEALTKR